MEQIPIEWSVFFAKYYFRRFAYFVVFWFSIFVQLGLQWTLLWRLKRNKTLWSPSGLCFAARFVWMKENTRFSPNAFQTLRFFCSGRDTKAYWQLTPAARSNEESIHSLFHTLTFSWWSFTKSRGSNIGLRPLGVLLLSPMVSLSSVVLWPLHAESKTPPWPCNQ